MLFSRVQLSAHLEPFSWPAPPRLFSGVAPAKPSALRSFSRFAPIHPSQLFAWPRSELIFFISFQPVTWMLESNYGGNLNKLRSISTLIPTLPFVWLPLTLPFAWQPQTRPFEPSAHQVELKFWP